jgi:hypothetical protein
MAACAAWISLTQRLRSSTLRGGGGEGGGGQLWDKRGIRLWFADLRATRSSVRSGHTSENDTYSVTSRLAHITRIGTGISIIAATTTGTYDCEAVAGQHLEHVGLLSQPDVCAAPCNYRRENRARDSTAGRRWMCRTFEASEADGVLGTALSNPLEELGKGEEFEGTFENTGWQRCCNTGARLVVGGDGEVAQLRHAVAAVPAARDAGLRGEDAGGCHLRSWLVTLTRSAI